MTLTSTNTIAKKDRAAKAVVTVTGAWAKVDDVAQGMDLIVVTGSSGSSQ